MTTYNTGNPLGSVDVRDLYDNAQNADNFSNGPLDAYPDRFGVSRKSLAGMEAEFDAEQVDRAAQWAAFLLAYGYQVLGPYGAGLVFTAQNQLFSYLGEFYAPGPSIPLPYTTTGVGATEIANFRSVGDAILRTDLASSAGAELVGYRARTVDSKLDEQLTVEDFGAVGDGVTNDSAAILAMHTATGGIIRLLDKPYLVGSLVLTAPVISIIGVRKPVYNADRTQLEHGSILIGLVLLRASVGSAENVGFDTGVGRGLPFTDGFIFDALTGQTGRYLRLQSITCLGRGPANATHGCLFEGWDSFDVDNVDVAEHGYGVVCKSRNGNITRVRGINIDGATVYVKSDIPAMAGDVASGRVSNVRIAQVAGVAAVGNTAAVGVWVHGATETISVVQVDQVSQLRGHSAYRVTGSAIGTPAVGISASNVYGIGTQYGFDDFGWTYESRVIGLQADNPTSGRLWSTTADSVNWTVDNGTLIITDVALNALTVAANCLGSGAYNNLTVRNSFLTMALTGSITAISHGVRNGQVIVAGEGTLVMANGAVADAPTPTAVLGPDNDISLTGTVNVQALSAAKFLNLPAGSLAFGALRFFPAVAQKTDNSYITVNLYASASDLLLLNYPVVGLKTIDLSSVRVKR